jgi:hypothetical protein
MQRFVLKHYFSIIIRINPQNMHDWTHCYICHHCPSLLVLLVYTSKDFMCALSLSLALVGYSLVSPMFRILH